MVAFRKWFPVLAILAMILGSATTANAQPGLPLTCDVTAGVPPIVRAEGLTELVGDIVLRCTGGNPSQAFLANFQVFLNTNITSRILSGSLSEATLIIDEAGGPGGAPVCVSPSELSNAAPATTGTSTPTSLVPGLAVVPGATAPTTCNPVTGTSTLGVSPQQGTYTMFRGTRPPSGTNTPQSESSIVWNGVPVVPPGSNPSVVRTFRFTNIRANAAQLGVSQTLIPTQIVAFVSISTTQSIAVNNPQQTVAFVQTGLLFSVVRGTGASLSTAGNFFQCVEQNVDLSRDPNRTTASFAQIGLRYREGFATAFKTRIETSGCGTGTVPTNAGACQPVSQPGVVYNTESGFVRPELGDAGIANSGTRLAARFTGVPAGVTLFVSTNSVPSTTSGLTSDAGSPTLQAVLVSTDPNGAGGGTLVTGTGGVGAIGVTPTTVLAPIVGGTSFPAAQVTITANQGLAVWEVVAANPALVEQAHFLIGVAYAANTVNNLPAIGISRVIGSFAPFYAEADSAGAATAATRASSSLWIPRFADRRQVDVQDFRIDECATNILFPYVTNRANFDTGIAIANTSADPFPSPNNRRQSGTCTVNYFGDTTGGTVPDAFTTNAAVEPGRLFIFGLSGGGNLGMDARGAGFQGYLIVRCRFQYAHGFAFISGPLGGGHVAEGYLGLIMDTAIGSRTGAFSEALDN